MIENSFQQQCVHSIISNLCREHCYIFLTIRLFIYKYQCIMEAGIYHCTVNNTIIGLLFKHK